MHIFTVSSIDGVFDSVQQAQDAWETAGRPQQRGNSVWITEHAPINGIMETVRTITIQPA